MERAERKGAALRRLLRSADRFNDAAICLGSFDVKTPLSSVSASLCSVTRRDQRRPFRECAVGLDAPLLRSPDLRFRVLCLLDAVAFLAMAPSVDPVRHL